MIATLLVVVSPAQAAEQNFLEQSEVHYLNRCGKFWPSSGMFRTTELSGNYTATLRFKLTQTERTALACVDQYLELDFHIRGFNVPSEWDSYDVQTDIPGAIHDTAKDDPAGNEATPGLTKIRVTDLVPNHEYYATVRFGLPVSGAPRVSFEWVPSYFATSFSQITLCSFTLSIYGPAMCYFPKTRVYLSHGYNDRTCSINITQSLRA